MDDMDKLELELYRLRDDLANLRACLLGIALDLPPGPGERQAA